jgi:glycosyltransferase involved in cell wall biosynthesis
MVIFFIHQNFPAQYLHLVSRLAAHKKNFIYFITQAEPWEIPGVRKVVYKPEPQEFSACHPFTSSFDAAVRNGDAVAQTCRHLRRNQIVPDIVLGHCGWGETLFVKDVFPDAPLLTYFEYFYHSCGADVGFDPEFSPHCEGDGARLLIRNAINRLSFAATDWGHAPTRWQRSLFPVEMQSRISLLHEGVDTRKIKPDPKAWLKLARENLVLNRRHEVITYVARNLEPYRGFHIFMRALPEILRRRPRAHVLIVGGNGVSYGDPPLCGGTYRQMMLNEVGKELDKERVHFLGQVPYHTYLNILQISSVHIYLTYPFVLSWSFLEAMAAGCLLLASATAPVREVLRDRENGLLVDFFSIDGICQRVDEALDHPDRMQSLREAARATAVEKFDTHSVALPRWERLLKDLARHRFPAPQPPEPGPATTTGLR